MGDKRFGKCIMNIDSEIQKIEVKQEPDLDLDIDEQPATAEFLESWKQMGEVQAKHREDRDPIVEIKDALTTQNSHCTDSDESKLAIKQEAYYDHKQDDYEPFEVEVGDSDDGEWMPEIEDTLASQNSHCTDSDESKFEIKQEPYYDHKQDDNEPFEVEIGDSDDREWISETEDTLVTPNSHRTESDEFRFGIKHEPELDISTDDEKFGEEEYGHEHHRQNSNNEDREEKKNQSQAKGVLFRCSICPKQYQIKINLTKHMRTHDSKNPFKCNVCYKDFTRMYNLQKHQQIVHSDLNFPSKNYVETHKKEKKFKCSECIKSFARKDGLQKHQRTHSGERPFRCQFCAKSFGRKSHLDYHIEIHTRAENSKMEYEVKCPKCPKTFTRKDSVQRHLRIYHSNQSTKSQKKNPLDIRFKCPECSRSFASEANLKEHQQIHIEVRTYELNLSCHPEAHTPLTN